MDSQSTTYVLLSVADLMEACSISCHRSVHGQSLAGFVNHTQQYVPATDQGFHAPATDQGFHFFPQCFAGALCACRQTLLA
mmetsp:Transcript_16697/g.44702  ORF Transcript_16697/g.44702 Transcript_16697/m.44702 type:complete len:81 (-) Transcript_16697:47-289(-)